MSDIVKRARELAHRAHAGQVDKAGRPYIEHVARVAARVADDPEAEAVAWLHDVMEDHPRFGVEFVVEYPYHIRRHVNSLTRSGFGDDAYYADIRSSPLALRVKLADIADNMDEERLALLDPKTANRLRRKYKQALKALGAE